eukprot:TRINITY_DN1345_c0_g1_i1.p2 TRINITY_DN1345_c0_g1~~TRINITY_DN1345_c0_g1_i1.p2  ORF type:complete len:347 (-),score=93.09 TRINITY_DN1345_c0_g1_i1:100-1140(-)
MEKFKIGEQPNWIGKEPNADYPTSFIKDLLSAPPTQNLIERGYTVIEIPPEVSDLYSRFHSVFEEFSRTDNEHKQKYATLYDKSSFSPNQFHGFSVVAGLKEQFMLRACGEGTNITTPAEYKIGEQTADMGTIGMQLYEELDLICRKYEREVLKKLGLDENAADKILDPIYKKGGNTTRGENDICHTDYVLPGFISSSMMDNFHYKHTSQPKDQDEKFHNNHASHSDSGLMTVVVVTDEPGLEVFDQKEKVWIALEQLLHKYLKETSMKSHRNFATIFWGDSYVYLKAPGLRECMHRVAAAPKERYSVVFKQRTSPTATAPRYQEDYELGALQLKSMDKHKAILSS